MSLTPEKSHLNAYSKKHILWLKKFLRDVTRFKDGKTRSLNISRLRNLKYSKPQIEDFINRKLEEFGKKVEGVDFYVDIEVISKQVQSQTDKILSDL